MGLKAVLRAVTPPFIWGGAHQVRVWIDPPPPPPAPPPPPPPPVWAVNFPSWEEAKAAAGVYEDEELTRFRLARFEANKRVGKLPAVTSQPLYWLAKTLGHDDVSVTDFGGAFGEYGLSFVTAFPDASYTVVETPGIVAAAPPGPVKFSVTMPSACDIFLTSGTLQYLDDPNSILRQGFKSASKAVVLARNCFSTDALFKVQRSDLFDNGDGVLPEGFENRPITYPVRAICENVVSEIASGAGFSLLLRSPEHPALLAPSVYSAMLVYVRCIAHQ